MNMRDDSMVLFVRENNTCTVATDKTQINITILGE